MIKSVMWSSMVDYPENVCTTLFLSGCNFNCEFCHNKNLGKNKIIDFDKEVLPKLMKRKNFINHIIISGGECTISLDFFEIVDKLYNNGFKIGIHTNGSKPDAIKKVINKLDFIGMDIKNDFSNYKQICGVNVDVEKVKKSVEIIIKSGIEYEFRTTVYPKYIDIHNVEEIAKYLKTMKAKEYVLQNYYDYNNNVKPYSKAKLEQMQKACSKHLPTKLRGII